jgi:AraC-like DNA-binding protein/quercetin dioxygenase-like cupin family protein
MILYFEQQKEVAAMGYDGVKLKNTITLGKIYSIHYFEYRSDFSFEGEAHDFWEFVYVDKGEVEVTADQSTRLLKKGDVIFHQPNEFHNVRATGEIAPNLVVISFACGDASMDFFRNRICKIDAAERNLLADIIVEARHFFDCRLDNPYLQNMPVKEPEFFGSGQLIRLFLEMFLIHLTRRLSVQTTQSGREQLTDAVKVSKRRSDAEIFDRVVNYLDAHISTTVSIEQICKDNLVGRSQLQKLFKERCDMGIIEYFFHRKIDAAKEMIRTDQMNFTQIAEQLGYSSIHYFSRQFKKVSGMTPSEYASSIKAMADGSF